MFPINFLKDVGGQDKVRPLWRHFSSATALIFVVDSADRDRIGEAKDEFHRAIQDRSWSDADILVLANKQDLPNGRLYYMEWFCMNVQSCEWYTACNYFISANKSVIVSCYHIIIIIKQVHYDVIPATSTALRPIEMVKEMGLTSLRDRIWYVQPTCATTGDGLYEGLEWLRSQHRGKEYDPRKTVYKCS